MLNAADRALDRMLDRLAEPLLPAAVMARMIAEIPALPQWPREEAGPGAAREPDPLRDRPLERLRGAVSVVGFVGGLAACLCAVLLFPRLAPPGPQAATPARVAVAAPALAKTDPIAPLARAATPAVPQAARRENTGDAPTPRDLAPEADEAAQLPPTEPAPVAPAAPDAQLAVTAPVGPPAPRGVDDEIGANDGTAISALPTGPHAPSGMGFDGGGPAPSAPRGFPGAGR